MNPSIFWSLLKQSFAEWQRDKVSRLAAALAYYTAFALAPVLVIVIAIASFLFEQSTVQGRIIDQLQSLLGKDGAEMVREMLVSAQSQDSNSFLATVVGVALLILGASGLFIQLQDALNTVWNVEARTDQGIWRLIRDRLLSFGMVLVIGFLLMVSLLLSAALTAVSGLVGSGGLPGLDVVWQIANVILSFGIITLLFGLIYKILPDAKIGWSDVWIGAAITALLFTIGKWLIGLYIGNSSAASAYGAAGSFVVLLLWIYYSAQILLFGAEFTQVYANRFGSRIQPDENATYAPDATDADKGKPDLPQTRSEYRAQRSRQSPSVE
ncbi:MAG: ribonuclease BN [Leptolyngbya foveolarum]|uniref:Ribonuclease BN n=1 Tax=Leptolyngbya foveolarum TaxID=47253 RepID=A0A2W4UR98_9CYAN|nr:MAG: ribonuclease BN [Leptolyngbya foveolarum]